MLKGFKEFIARGNVVEKGPNIGRPGQQHGMAREERRDETEAGRAEEEPASEERDGSHEPDEKERHHRDERRHRQLRAE